MGARLKAEKERPKIGFSVFEAFSFLLDDGNGCSFSQKTMKAPDQSPY
ncbi:MAG: hypothetical protein QXN96_01710 [Candidatus Bathyarchaeia archaeon]